ncbi:hypothetical protein NPIL_681631 [Nephila pilipes]|uniref:Uncharacterized protein n=1 Tax=Nephila pilipes TaxID=299642 RepID=A0A8X6MWN2_NEPPI|nr:hypothetical protein NPIL_681631 [Nephila pilipes]
MVCKISQQGTVAPVGEGTKARNWRKKLNYVMFFRRVLFFCSSWMIGVLYLEDQVFRNNPAVLEVSYLVEVGDNQCWHLLLRGALISWHHSKWSFLRPGHYRSLRPYRYSCAATNGERLHLLWEDNHASHCANLVCLFEEGIVVTGMLPEWVL